MNRFADMLSCKILAGSLVAWSIMAMVAATPLFADLGAAHVDRVVVKKSERLLLLIGSGKVLHRFGIALGEVPEGDKLEEGDWRTPEGRYTIDWRNPHSRFYKSMHISYPDRHDRMEAAAAGVDPGGMIMIHGYPPEATTQPEKYAGDDWTEGCIAVTNAEMDILWSLVADGTPIEIFP